MQDMEQEARYWAVGKGAHVMWPMLVQRCRNTFRSGHHISHPLLWHRLAKQAGLEPSAQCTEWDL